MAVTTSIPLVPNVRAMLGLFPVVSIRDTDGYDWQQISVFFGRRSGKYFWWADGGSRGEEHMRSMTAEGIRLLMSNGTREECIKAVRRWGVREDSLPVENFQEPA